MRRERELRHHARVLPLRQADSIESNPKSTVVADHRDPAKMRRGLQCKPCGGWGARTIWPPNCGENCPPGAKPCGRSAGLRQGERKKAHKVLTKREACTDCTHDKFNTRVWAPKKPGEHSRKYWETGKREEGIDWPALRHHLWGRLGRELRRHLRRHLRRELGHGRIVGPVYPAGMRVRALVMSIHIRPRIPVVMPTDPAIARRIHKPVRLRRREASVASLGDSLAVGLVVESVRLRLRLRLRLVCRERARLRLQPRLQVPAHRHACRHARRHASGGRRSGGPRRRGWGRGGCMCCC